MSNKAHPPELKKYMDKKISIRLNMGRTVNGILRGFDPYMNIVLDEAIEEISNTEKNSIGMIVIRGNSIIMVEAMERIV